MSGPIPGSLSGTMPAVGPWMIPVVVPSPWAGTGMEPWTGPAPAVAPGPGPGPVPAPVLPAATALEKGVLMQETKILAEATIGKRVFEKLVGTPLSLDEYNKIRDTMVPAVVFYSDGKLLIAIKVQFRGRYRNEYEKN